jgi:thioredoxin 1
MVKQVASADEFKEAVQVGPTVVDFTATWCGPCQRIAPLFAELDAKYSSVTFIKVDVDELDDVAGEAGVSAMPTFMVRPAPLHTPARARLWGSKFQSWVCGKRKPCGGGCTMHGIHAAASHRPRSWVPLTSVMLCPLLTPPSPPPSLAPSCLRPAYAQIFKGGAKVDELVGASPEKLEAMIKKYA